MKRKTAEALMIEAEKAARPQGMAYSGPTDGADTVPQWWVSLRFDADKGTVRKHCKLLRIPTRAIPRADLPRLVESMLKSKADRDRNLIRGTPP